MKKLNVLCACEESQIVTMAFRDLGHNAFSCDLQECSGGNPELHIQDDILKYLYPTVSFTAKCGVEKWDLLIAFPPCDYLSFAYTGKERYSIDRLQKKIHAYQFFLDLWKANIPHICLENPMGYIHSGLLPCTQIIEPYYWGKDFGEAYKKRTCIWLKNLPKLQYSKEDTLFYEKTSVTPKYTYINCTPKKRRKLPSILNAFADKSSKSKFHRGAAKAMAEQWSEYILEKEKLIYEL